MLPFYFVFFILSICVLWDTIKINSTQKMVFLIYIYFLLSFFAGLCINSRDYASYDFLFKILNDKTVSNYQTSGIVSYDSGFYILNRFLGIFTNSSLIIFLFMAFVSVGINLASYKKYTPFFFTAILLYFVHTYIVREMMQIRAGLVCAICLYSIRFIVNKNLKVFIILVLLAATIHLVAICFLFSYVICRLDISIKNWTKIIIISFIIGLIFPFGHLVKLIPEIELLGRIQNYNDWNEYSGSLGVFSNVTVLKELIIVIFCLYYYKRLKVCYAFKILLDIYIFSLCWLVVFNDFGIVAGRIATIFSIGEVILCASFYLLFNNRSKFIYINIIYLFAFLTLSLHFYADKIFNYKMISLF
ncbi:hypothetical protein EZS27_013412 [termite gut metagenome]|uniref:Transmembrane protein EpsG n=1 Tax=termite gut metagenome TaxID=433724 RepID=A0A5J4RXB4_9ZZZZ